MKNYKLHILFWLVWLTLAFLEDYFMFGMNFFYEAIYVLTQNVFLFYSFLYCIKRFSHQSIIKLSISIFRFLIVCVIFFILRYVIRYYVIYFINHDIRFRNLDINTLNIGSVVYIINYLLGAFGYFFFEKSLEREKALRLSEKEKMQQLIQIEEKEKQRIQFEQAFIRAQINPHFLYNVLSFLYSEALEYSEKMAESIYILSDIMRYSLQPETNINSKVPLEKEINYVQNFIKLNQFRFNNQLQITLKVLGRTNGIEISPMILMTFIENIFKHAELRDAENPAVIEMVVKNNQLFFYSRNKKKTVSSKEFSNGIGVENVKKRLSYIYRNDYYLNINNEESFYSINLTLFNL